MTVSNLRKIVGLGAGDHAKVIIEALLSMGGYEIIGLLVPNPDSWHSQLLGIPILGDDNLLPELRYQGIEWIFIGLGGVGDNSPRRILFEKAHRFAYHIADILHPQAIISPSVSWGSGLTVLMGAIINAGVTLGENVLINSGAILEHDCTIGSHVHIASGACLAGSVTIEAGAHIGLGASVLQGLQIGRGAIVGAGAVVTREVPAHTTVVGIPAKPIILKKAKPDIFFNTYSKGEK